MKSYLATIAIAIFAAGSLTYMADTEAAKRLGGGKSTGTQKQSIQKDATPPPAKPAAPAAAPAAGAAPAAAPAPSGMSRFVGPLAGLAAGGLLAAMFMGGAFNGLKFFDILLMVGLAVGIFFVVRMFLRKKAAEMGGMNQSNSNKYAAEGAPYAPAPAAPSVEPAAPSAFGRIATPEIGSRLSTANASAAVIDEATKTPRIPADFDVAPFERNSKAAFIRMQAANDAKDLADIRDFTTPEMYGELALQIQERGDAKQKTEVVSVDARVIEVVIEHNKAVASVRYTGVMREDDGQAEGFDEVWHVAKDVSDNNATWKLAGIQQLG